MEPELFCPGEFSSKELVLRPDAPSSVHSLTRKDISTVVRFPEFRCKRYALAGARDLAAAALVVRGRPGGILFALALHTVNPSSSKVDNKSELSIYRYTASDTLFSEEEKPLATVATPFRVVSMRWLGVALKELPSKLLFVAGFDENVHLYVWNLDRLIPADFLLPKVLSPLLLRRAAVALAVEEQNGYLALCDTDGGIIVEQCAEPCLSEEHSRLLSEAQRALLVETVKTPGGVDVSSVRPLKAFSPPSLKQVAAVTVGEMNSLFEEAVVALQEEKERLTNSAWPMLFDSIVLAIRFLHRPVSSCRWSLAFGGATGICGVLCGMGESSVQCAQLSLPISYDAVLCVSSVVAQSHRLRSLFGRKTEEEEGDFAPELVLFGCQSGHLVGCLVCWSSEEKRLCPVFDCLLPSPVTAVRAVLSREDSLRLFVGTREGLLVARVGPGPAAEEAAPGGLLELEPGWGRREELSLEDMTRVIPI